MFGGIPFFMGGMPGGMPGGEPGGARAGGRPQKPVRERLRPNTWPAGSHVSAHTLSA